jgi:soluble lytic murein transglycosylase-like protein
MRHIIVTIIAASLSVNASASCISDYIQRINPRISRETAVGVEHAVRYAAYPLDRAHPYYVHPYILLAIARNESSFNPAVGINRVGAHGLMQIIPKWHGRNVAKAVMRSNSDNLDQIAPNVYTGAEAFREMITRARGDRARAVQYYAGYPTLAASSEYRRKMLRTIRELQAACG